LPIASVATPEARSSLLVPNWRVQATVPGGSTVRVMLSLLMGLTVLVAVLAVVPVVRALMVPAVSSAAWMVATLGLLLVQVTVLLAPPVV
jgi:hypothetical protein